MKITDLETPAIIVRKEALEKNLASYQAACDANGKALWPMVKTHKSTALALRQKEVGAAGFLCGTLDECEALCEQGLEPIMYAYPPAGAVSCKRAAALAAKGEFFVRLDGAEAAGMLNAAAKEQDVVIPYTIIIDCGLHRFGVAPEKCVALAKELASFSHLQLKGISSHAGHVYGEADPAKISGYAKEEAAALRTAKEALVAAGFECTMVTTGSTPTFWGNVEDEVITVYHPGNYVFHDVIQMANGTAAEKDCALAVLATVISHPGEDLFLCDAGAKCLGLDQGAHGNASVRGHGRVIGHPELVVIGLSEEVGKLKVEGSTDLKVGDRILILPNHACSSANLTDYLILVDRAGEVVGEIAVDIRGNRTGKKFEP